MGFNMTLKIDGQTKIDRIIQNVSKLPSDLREPFKRIRKIIQRVISDNIIGVGRGDTWAPLSDYTMAEKAAKGFNTPPGVRTGEMSHSLTGDGGNTINNIERERAEFGAIGVKVATFQRGKYNQPGRNLLYLSDGDKRDILGEFIKEVRSTVAKTPKEFFGRK